MSVGEAQDLELLARDFARAADGEAGLRERVTADEDIGQAELAAERRHLGADLYKPLDAAVKTANCASKARLKAGRASPRAT
jgi:hypothetical protein